MRLLGLVLTVLLSVPLVSAPTTAVVKPVHTLKVTGQGASVWPPFDPAISRYALATTTDTGGTVTVLATSTDQAATVRVNGEVAPEGAKQLSGLVPGDEIAVFISDSSGTARYSLIYLPPGFPRLERAPGGSEPSAGHVMLTLGRWTTPSPFFETAVDANGVPAWVHQERYSMDLKRQPNGHYSVARAVEAGSDIVELDEQFREVRRHRMRGDVGHTDGHDALLLPDGSAYLMAYEPNADTGLTDAVVQHVGADGQVLFEWTSAPYVAESVMPPGRPDYAHINSLDVMDDGDLLLSFRHLDSVFKVARTAHDGYEEGEVIWKLGGRDSDFTFRDLEGDLDGGPCTQHTATELANGNVLVFDNGSWEYDKLCIDPANPQGATIARRPTRITEWSLDPVSGVATMVRNYQDPGRYAIFAGSAQALDNGHVVIGWASSTVAVASELDEQGQLIWDLRATEDPKYFTYRAHKTNVPDRIAPEVSIDLADGTVLAAGSQPKPLVECTDRGGSSLQTCDRGAIDTLTPGTRDVVVTATDGAGNRTSLRRSYTVLPEPLPPMVPPAAVEPAVQPAVQQAVARPRPDGLLRLAPARRFIGDDRYEVRDGQVARRALGRRRAVTAVVRIQNDGNVAEAMAVRVRRSWVGDDDSVRSTSRRRSPVLAPGESWTFRVRLDPSARLATRHRIRLEADVRSTRDGLVRDRVEAVVRVPPRG